MAGDISTLTGHRVLELRPWEEVKYQLQESVLQLQESSCFEMDHQAHHLDRYQHQSLCLQGCERTCP